MTREHSIKSKPGSAERTVKDIRLRTRKQHGAEEKIRGLPPVEWTTPGYF